MRISRRGFGTQICFLVSDVAPEYHPALRDLGFREIEEGFARMFPADAASLDRVFENFRRNGEEVILQAAGARPCPWDRALAAFLEKVDGCGVDWWLVGSASLAVQGLAVAPRDVDLAVQGEGAQVLAHLLLDHLVEPVQETEGWIARWFGRAFLHARVEWIGGVPASVDTPHPRPFGPAAARLLKTVSWQGRVLRVPPLELQLQDDERRGVLDRVENIRRALRRKSVG